MPSRLEENFQAFIRYRNLRAYASLTLADI